MVNSSTTTTYTTIPISPSGVISRSLHNLSSTISRHRPWPDLIASRSFSLPDSFPSALTRIRSNFHYFLINYSIIITATSAFSLIASPFTLLLFASLFSLWLLLHVFREDPLILWGRQLSDKVVLAALVTVSFLVVWASGGGWSLVWGVLVGVIVCGVHAAMREAEMDNGFSGDMENGVSGPLIGSNTSATYYGSVSDFVNK